MQATRRSTRRRVTELGVFDAAGTTGHEQIESVDCSEDGKTITVTYATPFADWHVIFTNILPAHIVEQQAGIDDIQAAYEAAVGAVTAPTSTRRRVLQHRLEPRPGRAEARHHAGG